MAVLGFLVFAAAFGASVWVMMATLVPAMPRIVALLSGEGGPLLAPQPALSVAQVRRRARPLPGAMSSPSRYRAAA